MNTNAEVYMDSTQAAEFLGLSPGTLARYRVDGVGPVYYRIGNRIRYKLSDLVEWREARRRISTSDDGTALRAHESATGKSKDDDDRH